MNAGHIRRNDKNSYSVPVLVQDYIAHIQSKEKENETHPKQADVAAHLDISDRTVRELEAKLPVSADYTLSAFRVAYLRHLREIAAGRSGNGELDLAGERAALAKVQRERIEMQNAITRRELAPVILIEQVLAKAGRKVAGILDAIPGMIKRRLTTLSADGLTLIAVEIAKARNIAAALSLADLQEDALPDAEYLPSEESD